MKIFLKVNLLFFCIVNLIFAPHIFFAKEEDKILLNNGDKPQSVAEIDKKPEPDDKEIEKIKIKDENEKKIAIRNNDRLFAYTVRTEKIKITYDPRTLADHSYIDNQRYLMEYISDHPNGEFYNVRLQSEIVAMKKEEVVLIKNSSIKSFPYYININGYLHHIVEGNPLESDSWYFSGQFGKAPSWMIPNKKYYSFNGIYFTEDRNLLGNADIRGNSVNYNNPHYDEYIYKSLRSKSVYNAGEMDHAFNILIKNNGKNDTVMRNTGKDFEYIQNRYGVNSMIALAMAIHESNYGTSNFAKERNNLFGIAAYDDAPGSASRFKSVQECIHQHGNNLSWTYADADYQRNRVYYGSQLGNKSCGMNVKYASDPYWGEKIANHMARIDRLLGEKDYGRELMIMLPQGMQTYWTRNKNQKAHKYKVSTSTLGYMYSTVLREINGTADKILLEPPYTPGQIVSPTQKEGGVFNNYEGYLDNSDYKIIGEKKKIDEYHGNILLRFYLDDGKITKAEQYINNKKIRIYEYYPNTYYGKEHHKHIKLVFYLKGDETLDFCRQYNDNVIPTETNCTNIYEYYPNTYYGQEHYKHIQLIFTLNNNNNILWSKLYSNNNITNDNAIAVYNYYPGTKYGQEHHKHIQFIHHLIKDERMLFTKEYKDLSLKHDKNSITAYEFFNNTKYSLDFLTNKQFKFFLKENEIINYTEENLQNGILTNIYEYFPNTIYGDNHGKKIKYIYNIHANKLIICAFEREINVEKNIYKYIFKEGTYYGKDVWDRVVKKEKV